MKNILLFFLDVARLKTVQRTGWMWRGIRNPETIAEHSFRLTFFAWVLGMLAGIHVKKAMEIALLHDLCEAYAGDLTPYYGIMPADKKRRSRMLQRWIRLPQKEKAALVKKRIILEKKALLKLVKPLNPWTRQKILFLWNDFEYGLSPEGKFVKQIDKIEAMLQAIEYFGTKQGTPVTGWWEEVEELVEHPFLKQFVKALEERLYHKKRTDLDGALEFLIAAGRLKRLPHSIWVVRKIRSPDSEANHAFMLGVTAWIFSKEQRLPLDAGKLLKMSLIQCFYRASKKNTLATIYDSLLEAAQTPRERKKLLEKWVRYSLAEKQKIFFRSYGKEKSLLSGLVKELPPLLKKDLMHAWEELKKNRTPEARFVNQTLVLEVLLQALRYKQQGEDPQIKAWWEWAYELSDSELNIEFMDVLKKYFSKQKKRAG